MRVKETSVFAYSSSRWALAASRSALTGRERCYGDLLGAFGRFQRGTACVNCSLGDKALLEQGRIPSVIAAGKRNVRFGLGNECLGHRDVLLCRALGLARRRSLGRYVPVIQRSQRLTPAYRVALVGIQRTDDPCDAGADRDRYACLEGAWAVDFVLQRGWANVDDIDCRGVKEHPCGQRTHRSQAGCRNPDTRWRLPSSIHCRPRHPQAINENSQPPSWVTVDLGQASSTRENAPLES